MGETNFEFMLDFDTATEEKAIEQRLDHLNKEHSGDLAPIMKALLRVDHLGNDEISIDSLQRNNSAVYLFGYGGRSTQPPFGLAASFYELG